MPIPISSSSPAPVGTLDGRLRFPSTDDRLVYESPGPNMPLYSRAGVKVKFYTDAGGSVLADIVDNGGTAIPGSELTVNNDSQIPEFFGPVGTEVLYVRAANGAPYPIFAWLQGRYNDLNDELQTAVSSSITFNSRINALEGEVDQLQLDPALQNSVLKGTLVLNVKDFGAVGNGIVDDRVAVQNAIDAANDVYESTGSQQVVLVPTGVYRLSVVPYIRDDGVTVFGITSLKMRDGVILDGSGTFKILDNQYGEGALYNAISSRDGVRLSNAVIRNITIDGNKTNQVASTQCSNILLEVQDNVTIENVRSINANGNALMMRGTNTSFARNVKFLNNTVLNANTIGIQCSQFDGLTIANNYIEGTGDNCIDIYGEDGSLVCHGKNFTITGNNVKNGLVGIFPETVRDGVVSGNTIQSCALGITVNRINGEPNAIIIDSNVVISCPTAIRVTGDTGGVLISNNMLRAFTTSGVTLGGGGNCSRVLVKDNFFNPESNTVFLVTADGAQSSFNTVIDNYTNSIDTAFEYNITATVQVSNDFFTIHSMDKRSRTQQFLSGTITISSGESITYSPPGFTSGTLTIRGGSGGAWDSIWVGTVIVTGTRVDVSQMGTDFTFPGNLIASVVGSETSTAITINTTATGGGGFLLYSYDYF